jgi:hypothetical protein
VSLASGGGRFDIETDHLQPREEIIIKKAQEPALFFVEVQGSGGSLLYQELL